MSVRIILALYGYEYKLLFYISLGLNLHFNIDLYLHFNIGLSLHFKAQ